MHQAGWIGNWSPGIGDPTLLGWLTVCAYFLATSACWKARERAIRSARPNRSRLLWTLFSLCLLLLGINKQLDLQSAFTETGRLLAHHYGWYGERRKVQLLFIGTVAIAGTGFLLLLLRAARHELGKMLLALFGMAGLCTFVLVRAASFHHVDRLIHFSLLGLRVNGWLELGSIALVGLGALLYRRGEPDRPDGGSAQAG